ncbi:CCA tRNA nucleotidyltransferase [Patescibacteria group bacterium]|nr:CCA tRNA nucleotidyltransferase [Patescibacteria group bacterium]
MDRRFDPVSWLKDAGYRAYLVGNQTRNKLLGVNYDPKDIDIATDAKPGMTVAVLRRQGVIPAHTNETFGVVSFTWQGSVYEITTFREDLYDAQFDHIKRVPKQIIFVDDLEQDAKRRDFSINAIYWDPTTGYMADPVGGKADLSDRLIRLIGDADLRLKEDPVRILRAIRFKHGLGFKYDRSTALAIKRQVKLIHKLPTALLKREFQKIQNLPRYATARKEMQRLKIVGRF